MLNLTILYVEDDAMTRSLMEMQMKNSFQNVLLASNGEEALRVLQNEKIDIIITDLAMPVMNGYEMIKEIRETDKDIKIITLSAYRDHESESYVNYCLSKPVQIKEIINAISKIK